MHPCPCAPPVYDFIMVSRPLYVMLCWGALIRGSSTLISSGGSSSPVGNQVSFTNSTLSPLLNSVVHLHHWAIKFSIANYTLFPLLSSLAHPHHQAISFSIANLTLSSLLNFAWFSPLFREGGHTALSVVAAICNLQIFKPILPFTSNLIAHVHLSAYNSRSTYVLFPFFRTVSLAHCVL